MIPATEATLIIVPPPCSFMTLATAWLRKNRPFRFRFMMESQARSSTSRAGSIVGLVAALLTSMSILPNSSITLGTRAAISSILPTCVATAIDIRPRLLISVATSSRSGSFLLVTTTSAPNLANPTAMAFPMPRLPPVTSATLPASEKTSGETVITVPPDADLPALDGDRQRSISQGYAVRKVIGLVRPVPLSVMRGMVGLADCIGFPPMTC